MTTYDDYFTDSDKPFAENINDALLLSNVFDFTIPIRIPEMFGNSTWVNTTSRRKCGVAIVTLKESLPNGISISTSNNQSVLTGSGTVKLGFYGNFNSFGKIKSINWEGTGSIRVNLKTVNGTTIASNISKGTITSESSELRKLQEIVIELVLSNATLTTLEIVMQNKQQERYGADVGISNVTGLQENLDSKVNVSDVVNALNNNSTTKPLSANQGRLLNNAVNNKVDKISGKGLSTNDFDNEYKSKLDNIKSTVTPLYLGSNQKGTLIQIKNENVTWLIYKLNSYTAYSIEKLSPATDANLGRYMIKNPFGRGDMPYASVWIHYPSNSNIQWANIGNETNNYWGIVSLTSGDINLGNVIIVGLQF